MEKLQIYEAVVGKFKDFYAEENEICVRCNDNSKKIIGVRYHNLLYDVESHKEYNIIVKENSNQLELGVNIEKLYYEADYIFNLKPLEKVDILIENEAQNIINSLPETKRIYYSKLKSVGAIEQNGDTMVVNMCEYYKQALGIIEDNKFIDISKKYEPYEIEDFNKLKYTDDTYENLKENTTYASDLEELDSKNCEKYLYLVSAYEEYKKKQRKIIAFKK